MNAGPLVLTALAIGVATAALAQDRTVLPNSGSIKIHSGWRANGEGVQVAENHLLYSGVVWGVTFNDAGSGPLHMGQAVCALASETTNGGGTGEGHCAWGNADGKSKILTSFSGKVAPAGRQSAQGKRILSYRKRLSEDRNSLPVGAEKARQRAGKASTGNSFFKQSY